MPDGSTWALSNTPQGPGARALAEQPVAAGEESREVSGREAGPTRASQLLRRGRAGSLLAPRGAQSHRLLSSALAVVSTTEIVLP